MKKYFESNSILKKALLLTAGVLALAVMIVALVNIGRPTIVLAGTPAVASPVKNKYKVKPRPETPKQETAQEEALEEDFEEEDEFDYDDGSGIDLLYSEEYDVCEDRLDEILGALFFNGHKETYYSEHVLPGEGLDIPGRHVADDGTIRDENGYICVAADPEFLPYGATVLTTLGPAKVYDCG
ncbi:MAG: hypothetical protein Q4F70_06415, partial [Clostridia bacterium]|nr:hypothetical protein [Clostridia bacterium]